MSVPIKNKKMILALIYLLPALVTVLIVLNKVFPSQTYFFELKNLDQSNIILNKDNSFTITPFHDFKKIKISLEFEPGDKNDRSIEVTAKKGFATTFYPSRGKESLPGFELKKYANRFYLVTKSEKKLVPTSGILESYGKTLKIKSMSKKEFNNLPLSQELTGFLDGTLINHRESIFVIADGKKVAIASPQIFDELKYDWGKVIPVKESEARIHSNSPFPLGLDSAHPNGTILEDASSRKYFLVDKGERIKLSQEIYEKYYSTITPIKVPSNYEEKATALDKNNTCVLELNESLKSKEGNAYYFKLPDEIQITKLKITFSRSFSWGNIRTLARKFR